MMNPFSIPVARPKAKPILLFNAPASDWQYSAFVVEHRDMLLRAFGVTRRPVEHEART